MADIASQVIDLIIDITGEEEIGSHRDDDLFVLPFLHLSHQCRNRQSPA